MTNQINRKAARRNYFLLTILFVGFLLLSLFIYESLLKKPDEVHNGYLRQEQVFNRHTQPLWAVQFNPANSALLASGGVDSTVRIWSRDSGRVLQILKQPLGITTLDYSPDGKFIVTGSYDGVVRVWDWAANTIIKELKGHKGTIWSLAFSPDGKNIASCGEDRTVKLWNVESGILQKSINAHLLNIWKVRFTPNGKNIISSSFDHSIKIWSVADGVLLKTFEGHSEAVVGLAVSPDGRLLASGSDDKTIRLWDIGSGKLLHTLQNGDGHVYAVAFSPDGRRLISGSRDKDNLGEIFQNFFGDSKAAKGISMRLWEVESGKLLEAVAEHANDVMDVCYSADGKWIASASTDKTVRLWRVMK